MRSFLDVKKYFMTIPLHASILLRNGILRPCLDGRIWRKKKEKTFGGIKMPLLDSENGWIGFGGIKSFHFVNIQISPHEKRFERKMKFSLYPFPLLPMETMKSFLSLSLPLFDIINFKV